MGKIIGILLGGGIILAVAFMAFDAHEKQVTELDYDLRVTQLRAQYVERSGWVRSIPETERWRNEFVSLNSWFEAEWTALHNRYPGRGSVESVLASIEAEQAAGAKADAVALKKEFFEHTRGFHKLLSSGRYQPIAHHVASGVRIDLLDLRQESYEGRTALRVDAVVWGAPRQELKGKVDGREAYRKIALDFAFNSLGLEFIDAKEKLIGGGDTGAPVLLVDLPERWVPAFPPQAALATWWVEPMPNETKTVLLRMNGDIRSGNGAYPVSAEWRLPASEGWKLGEGQAFVGDERVMAEEDMDRSK